MEGICEKYGIQQPEQLIDILGLWGDSADNIPGVPGIGEVKAKKLIAQFGSIENIYHRINEVDNAKLRQTLIDNEEKALQSKALATIILDVPIEYHWDDMKFGNIHVNDLQAVFNELQFKTLSTRIFNDLNLRNTPPAPQQPDMFSALENEATTPSAPAAMELPLFNSFDQQEHHFESTNQYDGTGDLYFEWLLNEGKIAGFFFADEQHIFYHLLEKEHHYFKNILQNIFGKERLIITYNCKQSYKFLELLGIPVKARFFDLQIAHYLIQPENSHQLSNLSENYLNYAMFPEIKKLQPTVKELLERTDEQVEIYRQLYPIFNKELDDNGLRNLFDEIEMPLAPVLAKMENNGIHLNKEILAESSRVIGEEIKELEEQIYNFAGEKFNIGSPKQL